MGCTGVAGSVYVFVNASTSASPATVAFKWPSPSSTTVTVTLYACLSYVTFACASSSSVSANSYVPGLSNVSAGKAILPSAAFFALSSVPSAAVSTNVNCPSSRFLPTSVLEAPMVTVVDVAW